MFVGLSSIVEREAYMIDFKTLVLYDVYEATLQEGLRYNYAPYRPEYDHEEAFMSKKTNELHKSLISDRNRDIEAFRNRVLEKAKGKIDQEISLETFFKYLKTSQYRFEDYFDDWQMVYPFNERQSERYRSFMDTLANEVLGDPELPDYRQAGFVFIGSLRYMLKDIGVDERTKTWYTIIHDVIGMTDRRYRNAVMYGESVSIDHVLKTSYHFQVHPYQLLGLRYTRYHEIKTKIDELLLEPRLLSAYMTKEDKVTYKELLNKKTKT